VGVYSVTYIIETANGCRDTVVCNNCTRAGVKPTTIFGIVDDTVCYGMPVSFVDSTINETGWLWNFGDGSMSNLQNPTHVYGIPGTFNVYLITYHNGCPDTSVIKPVVIHPPKAQFSVALTCSNYYNATFTSTSIGADSLFWDFGDGSQDSSNTINPSHSYGSRGSYTVTLTAYNYASGCTNSTVINITIAEPIASFTQTAPKGCYPFLVNFNSTSQDAWTLSWNLSNGNTSTAINTNATYSTIGIDTITLIITDVNGCKDTATSTVTTVGPTPYFYADTLTGCTPFPVTFIDTSFSDSTLVQWIWNFGDGTIDTTRNDSIVHIYTTPGIYTISMTVKDTNGCSKVLTIPNYIQPTFPYPAFTVDTFACAGDVLTFNSSATIAIGATYIWDFDDGTIDTTTNTSITHAYSADGLYTVSLTVEDINGCDSTITMNVRIEKPTANFGWAIQNVGCGTLQVAFTDSSYQSITAWQWNFGNGASSTLQNPIYTYTSPGVYSVSLIVTNAGGCKDTVLLDSIITVYGPIGTFTFNPASGCIPLTVTFIANSSNTQQYIWDFGDGTVINGNDTIVHTYTYVGTFNPILILGSILPNGNPCLLPATNLTGAVNSYYGYVTSINPSVITIPEDDTYAVFPVVSSTASPSFSWTPTVNVNCPTCQNVIITGSGDSIVYYFTVVDTNGCIGRDSLLVISPECVKEKLIPNVFTPDGDGKNDLFFIPGVCDSEDYSLNIYNRWGALIFSTTHRDNRWDGNTMAGKEAPAGTYYFMVKVFDKTYTGFVELLR
jgi:gliding motility-associated-like protein